MVHSRTGGLALTVLAALVMTGVAQAHAASCTAGAPVISGEAQALTRQISTLSKNATARGCTGRETGLFSACRDIERRLATARRTYATIAPAGGCPVTPKPVIAKAPAATQKAVRVRNEAKTPVATMCVRLSDGYYFPSPNSGFGARKKTSEIAAQCRLICATPDMDVFEVKGDDPERAAMVSLTTGKAYSDLGTAGRYRTATEFSRCDMTRYARLMQSVAPAAEPSDEPKADRADATELASLFADDGLRGSFQPVKTVRIVVAPFLPPDETPTPQE